MLFEGLSQNRLIKLIQIKHPNFTFQLRHILNNLIGLGLPDTEIIGLTAISL